MRLRANCKINIGLDITHRRQDGFHDLETVMYPITELYDELIINSLTSDEVEFSQSGIVVDCPAEKNLCVRAARLMQLRYATKGVQIILNKALPFGAGLGGGSADATAVIGAMNEIYALELTTQELCDIAAELGSDTPFFVHNTPQLCTGRGEVMSPIALDLSQYKIVIIKPDVAISTAVAFSGVVPRTPSVPLEELIKLPIEQWQGRVKNQFEEHLFPLYPQLAEIKKELLSMGALYASMSGSGSAIYGIFDPSINLEKCYSTRWVPSQILTSITSASIPYLSL